jgi:hypothetical protein
MTRDQGEDGVEDVAADIIEIDIDPVRAMRTQIRRLVVNRRIKPELVDDVAVFRSTPRDTHRAASLDFRDPTVAPTAPAAPDTTTVSPSFGALASSKPK